MGNLARLLVQRRFLPLFVTQFLNAFNDNLYKMAIVVLVTFTIYDDPAQEASFNALAGAVFILPFFLLSALSGQLSDSRDKAKVIRTVKTAEILIMIVGAAGIWLHNIPMMLGALFAMGVHSTFFGPIKYAILPQHLDKKDVLAGTGLVEAGTYIAILMGTIAGGLIPSQYAGFAVLAIAVIGRVSGHFVPPAPPETDAPPFRFDWHIVRASIGLVRATMHIRKLFLAIIAISFFWAIGAILAAQFPPLVKNVLGADKTVATLFTAIFSIGVAIGSVVINRMLKGEVSARYSPISVIIMGLIVLDLWWQTRNWPKNGTELMGWQQFVMIGKAEHIMLDVLGIAIAGGMFVVPLYAFLTTTVPKSETARTVAANNIVNSGAMVLAALLLDGLIRAGVTISDTILMVALSCGISAYIAWRLHKSESIPH